MRWFPGRSTQPEMAGTLLFKDRHLFKRSRDLARVSPAGGEGGRGFRKGRVFITRATAREAKLCSDATVIVAGGGQFGRASAMFLSEHARKSVLVIVRGALTEHVELSFRAWKKHNIEMLTFTEVRK